MCEDLLSDAFLLVCLFQFMLLCQAFLSFGSETHHESLISVDPLMWCSISLSPGITKCHLKSHATVCYHANSAWRRFSEPAWAMTGGVFKSQRWRCDVIAGKDRLVCWLVSHALMHSLKRTPGSRAEAHAQCRHTHGKHTILHICTKWHTAAECIKGKRLHHLVVWHEVASECCRIHKLNFSIKY